MIVNFDIVELINEDTLRNVRPALADNNDDMPPGVLGSHSAFNNVLDHRQRTYPIKGASDNCCGCPDFGNSNNTAYSMVKSTLSILHLKDGRFFSLTTIYNPSS